MTNLELVKHGYANFKQGNIPALLDLLSEDISWELPKSAGVAFSGVFKGKAGVMQFFKSVAELNDMKEFEIDQIIPDGDTVVALGRLTAVARNTGKTSNNRWAHVWKMKDGKVTSHYEFADTAEIHAAFH